MRSERGSKRKPCRAQTGGVILLEVLIAFAIMAVVATVALRVTTGTALDESRRLQRAVLLEFARSKAEEYAVAFPQVATEGEELGGWAWSVTETRVHPDGPNRFDGDIALFELRLTVWHVARPRIREEAQTIVARRAD